MLLNAEPDMEVIGEVSDGHEAVEKTVEVAPDILVLDITMPELGGIDVIKQLRTIGSKVTILILTMHENERYLLQALSAGAVGYIPKKAAEADLISAIRAVYNGEMYVHSSLTRTLVENIIDHPEFQKPESEKRPQLSQRETEVLVFLAQGHTNKQVADKIGVSVKTVESYKARVIQKLNLNSRVELVRYALDLGLLED